MAFNPDTGEWTDGFDATGKQGGAGPSVPSIDTPAQVDPSGKVTATPGQSPLDGGATTVTPSLPTYPDPVAQTVSTDPAPPLPNYPDPVARQAEFDASQRQAPIYPNPAAMQAASGPTATSSSPLGDLARQRIMDMLNTPQNVSAESVAASPEAAAERLQSQRGTDRALAQSAEQAAQGGTGTAGGQEGIQRGILQAQGETDANFSGQLASTLRQQQIGKLTQGITFALQSGQFDQAQALQRQLAELQSATTRGIASDQIGYNYTALQEQANRDALIAALGGL